MGDQYGFHFDAKLCTGCKTCMLACKDYCNLDSASAYRQVYEMQGGGWTVLPDGTLQQDCFAYYVSLACNHCTNPACVANCPTRFRRDGPESRGHAARVCGRAGRCRARLHCQPARDRVRGEAVRGV